MLVSGRVIIYGLRQISWFPVVRNYKFISQVTFKQSKSCAKCRNLDLINAILLTAPRAISKPTRTPSAFEKKDVPQLTSALCNPNLGQPLRVHNIGHLKTHRPKFCHLFFSIHLTLVLVFFNCTIGGGSQGKSPMKINLLSSSWSWLLCYPAATALTFGALKEGETNNSVLRCKGEMSRYSKKRAKTDVEVFLKLVFNEK